MPGSAQDVPVSDDLRRLRTARCTPLPPGTSPLTTTRVAELLGDLPGWQLEAGSIVRRYRFSDYYETIAFVNACAWLSHREDHHPELLVGYSECRVTYRTHSIDGLSENDFICAAKLDALLEP